MWGFVESGRIVSYFAVENSSLLNYILIWVFFCFLISTCGMFGVWVIRYHYKDRTTTELARISAANEPKRYMYVEEEGVIQQVPRSQPISPPITDPKEREDVLNEAKDMWTR